MEYQFETLVNFRDLGGLQTKDGRTIKKRKLLRSAMLHQLSERDRKMLVSEYELKAIIDLRTDGEIVREPNDSFLDIMSYQISLIEERNDKAPSLERFLQVKKEDEIQHMEVVYRDLIRSKKAQDGYRQMFDILLQIEDGACLWHCFAGKDRTGISAALILYILGVDYPTILHDYLLTNQLRETENQRRLDELRKVGANDEQLEVLLAMLSVQESFIEAAIKQIEEDYESVDRYLKEALHVTDEEILTLQQKYLDESV